MLRRRPTNPPEKGGLRPPIPGTRAGAFPTQAPSKGTGVIRTVLLAGAAALALVTTRPADAQMPVIDVKSIDQLVDQMKVLQQQLQQAEQIYQETIGVYNQAVSIVKSVSGLTNANSLAPGLNSIGLQNPLPTGSASLPGFIGGPHRPPASPTAPNIWRRTRSAHCRPTLVSCRHKSGKRSTRSRPCRPTPTKICKRSSSASRACPPSSARSPAPRPCSRSAVCKPA